MKNPEEQDELWKLLGKARTPQASPFFARNILREIRTARPEKTGVLHWLRQQWRALALSGVAAVLLAMNAAQFLGGRSFLSPVAVNESKVEPVKAVPARSDYEVIKNLDELLAYEEHSIWLDDSTQ